MSNAEPADDHRESIAYLIRTAFRSFRRLMQHRATAAGVSLQEWYALRVLPERVTLSQRALAERADGFESNAVAVVRGLAQRGLISLTRDALDRRHSRVQLTEEGADIRRDLLEASRLLNEAALYGFSPGEVATYRRLTQRIILNLRRVSGEA